VLFRSPQNPKTPYHLTRIELILSKLD